MLEIRKKFDEEFKKNAVKLSYASPKKVGNEISVHIRTAGLPDSGVGLFFKRVA
jgi:hypothetical protein